MQAGILLGHQDSDGVKVFTFVMLDALQVFLPSANARHWSPEEMNAAIVVAHAAGWIGVPPLLPCVRVGAVPSVIGQALERAFRIDAGDPPTVAGLQAAVESALREMQLEPAAQDNDS